MKLLPKCIIIVFAVCISFSSVASAAIQVQTGIFGNNVYEVYLYQAADDKNWTPAKDAALLLTNNGVSGHLATITSLGEDTFINNLGIAAGLNEMWVGGFQVSGSTEPGAGWTWVNGDGIIDPTNATGLNYTNWLNSEPNNVNGEDFLAIRLGGNFGWNDEGNLGNIVGYVVEYDNAIPEPTTIAIWGLLGLAASGNCWWRRRRKV